MFNWEVLFKIRTGTDFLQERSIYGFPLVEYLPLLPI